MNQKDHKTTNKNRLSQYLFTLFFWAIFTIITLNAGWAKTTLKVGVYNNKPTIFLDEEQNVKGFFIDLLEHIAKEENWEIEYSSGHFSEMFEKLQRGEIDLLPAVAYSVPREKLLDFTHTTVMANWAELYSSSDLVIESLKGLEGKKVAVKGGDIHFHFLKEMTRRFNISCRFLEADEYETVLEIIHFGAADIGVVNRLYGNRMKEHFNINDSPVIFNPIEMKFASTKGKHELTLNKLDRHIAAFKEDEKSIYYQSINRWFLLDSQKNLPSWLFTALYIIVGFTVIVIGIAVLFKYQVHKQTKELKALNADLKEKIRENKKAEEALRRIARMVDASNDAMALIRKDNKHLFINSAYRELVCKDEKYDEHISLKVLLGEEFYEKHLKNPIRHCLEGHVLQIVTPPWKKIEREEGGWWNVTLSPYYELSGGVTGYVIGIHDITEQMELENKLKIKQKMEAVGLLAGGVAHDLNNILSGVVSYPDMLLLNRDEDDPLTKPLRTIKKSGERAATIVQDMLTMSRRGTSNFTPLNLNTVINEFLESPEYTTYIQSTEKIKTSIKLCEELNNIYGSPVHLSKILLNLVSNAIEALPDGGDITISTSNCSLTEDFNGYETIPKGQYVVFSITDSGVGMTETIKNRIFEPFYSKKVLGRSGTGLGMAIVWGCVKDHNGYIDVQTVEGQYTHFTLYFPKTSDKEEKGQTTELEKLYGSGERILLVDDLEEQRNLGQQIITNLGYEVELASSGEEAVEACRHKTFDLIILDMIMPGGMDGLETYKKISTISPNQKTVVASGFSNNKKVEEIKHLSAGAYVQKPYSIEQVAQTIFTVLKKD